MVKFILLLVYRKDYSCLRWKMTVTQYTACMAVVVYRNTDTVRVPKEMSDRKAGGRKFLKCSVLVKEQEWWVCLKDVSVVEQLRRPVQTYQEHKDRKCPKCFVHEEVTFVNVTSAKTAKLQLEKYNLAIKSTCAHQGFSTWTLKDHNNIYWALLFKIHITVRGKRCY